MSLVSDYHGKGTRSRDEHPSNQRLRRHHRRRIAGGVDGSDISAGGPPLFSWASRASCSALVLGLFIREPVRNQAERADARASRGRSLGRANPSSAVRSPRRSRRFRSGSFMREFLTTPSAVVLLIAFPCVNFVAWVVISWMPKYLYRGFQPVDHHGGRQRNHLDSGRQPGRGDLRRLAGRSLAAAGCRAGEWGRKPWACCSAPDRLICGTTSSLTS